MTPSSPIDLLLLRLGASLRKGLTQTLTKLLTQGLAAALTWLLTHKLTHDLIPGDEETKNLLSLLPLAVSSFVVEYIFIYAQKLWGKWKVSTALLIPSELATQLSYKEVEDASKERLALLVDSRKEQSTNEQLTTTITAQAQPKQDYSSLPPSWAQPPSNPVPTAVTPIPPPGMPGEEDDPPPGGGGA